MGKRLIKQSVFVKCVSVIDSCKTKEQFLACEKYLSIAFSQLKYSAYSDLYQRMIQNYKKISDENIFDKPIPPPPTQIYYCGK